MFKRTLSALALTAAAALAVPASAHAGNGTNDFYIKASCRASNASWLGGIDLKFTNWDNGPGRQIYHIAVSRTGPAFAYDGLYFDGKYVNKVLGETDISRLDVKAHSIQIRGTILGSPIQCGRTR